MLSPVMQSAIMLSVTMLHYNVEYVGCIGPIFFTKEIELIIYGLYYKALLQDEWSQAAHMKFIKSW